MDRQRPKHHRTSWTTLRSDFGATSVEYALMAALIAMVIVGAVAFLGTSTSGAFCDATDEWAAVDDSVDPSDDC